MAAQKTNDVADEIGIEILPISVHHTRHQTLDRMIDHAWRITALPLLLFIIIPIIMLFTRAMPMNLVESLGEKQVQLAIWVSLKTTLISLGIIVILGTPLSYLIGRHRFRFKRLAEAVIELPILLPPSVAGLALLLTFGRQGLFGSWLESADWQVSFTQTAVILVQVFIAAPFFVRTAALGFATVDQEIIQAAQLDGANRWQVFQQVVFPLSKSALIGGSMMSWARALGEFGATIIFAGNFIGRTQTMPTAIYLGFEMDLDTALTLSVILVVVSFGSILLVKWLVGGRE